ncbi:hypothetical protein CRG98_021841, partial [Punica granatum]
ANCSPVALRVQRWVTPNWPRPSSFPMVYKDLTSSMGRPKTGPIGVGLAGFVEAPETAGPAATFGRAMEFSWPAPAALLVLPGSAMEPDLWLACSSVAREQQLPMSWKRLEFSDQGCRNEGGEGEGEEEEEEEE